MVGVERGLGRPNCLTSQKELSNGENDELTGQNARSPDAIRISQSNTPEEKNEKDVKSKRSSIGGGKVGGLLPLAPSSSKSAFGKNAILFSSKISSKVTVIDSSQHTLDNILRSVNSGPASKQYRLTALT